MFKVGDLVFTAAGLGEVIRVPAGGWVRVSHDDGTLIKSYRTNTVQGWDILNSLGSDAGATAPDSTPVPAAASTMDTPAPEPIHWLSLTFTQACSLIGSPKPCPFPGFIDGIHEITAAWIEYPGKFPVTNPELQWALDTLMSH